MYKSIDFTSLVSISYVYVPTWWMGLVLALFVVFVATTNILEGWDWVMVCMVCMILYLIPIGRIFHYILVLMWGCYILEYWMLCLWWFVFHYNTLLVEDRMVVSTWNLHGC